MSDPDRVAGTPAACGARALPQLPRRAAASAPQAQLFAARPSRSMVAFSAA